MSPRDELNRAGCINPSLSPPPFFGRPPFFFLFLSAFLALLSSKCEKKSEKKSGKKKVEKRGLFNYFFTWLVGKAGAQSSPFPCCSHFFFFDTSWSY